MPGLPFFISVANRDKLCIMTFTAVPSRARHVNHACATILPSLLHLRTLWAQSRQVRRYSTRICQEFNKLAGNYIFHDRAKPCQTVHNDVYRRAKPCQTVPNRASLLSQSSARILRFRVTLAHFTSTLTITPSRPIGFLIWVRRYQ